MPRADLTQREQRDLYTFMEEHALMKVGVGNKWDYCEGWNDDRVVLEGGKLVPRLNKGHVQRARRQVYEFEVRPRPSARITNEQRFSVLEDMLLEQGRLIEIIVERLKTMPEFNQGLRSDTGYIQKMEVWRKDTLTALTGTNKNVVRI